MPKYVIYAKIKDYRYKVTSYNKRARKIYIYITV